VFTRVFIDGVKALTSNLELDSFQPVMLAKIVNR
jgi:hypothetical protein